MNKPLENNFASFLTAVVADARQHQRFLNMLSMLEHMGSRKIMLSQMNGVLTQDILKHLAEETRHAFFFKREAEKISESVIEGYPEGSTMSAAAARFYFGRLDATLAKNAAYNAHQEAGYLWMSLIVEVRAIWVYRLYQNVLKNAAFPLSLTSVIAEEDKHLQDMFARLNELELDMSNEFMPAHLAEKKLFEKLLLSLNREMVSDSLMREAC